jgi:cyclic beta-1,2-glucan synthetase
LTQPANEHRSGVEGQAHGAGRLRLQEVAAALARDHNLASRPRPAPSPLDRLQTLGNLLQAAHAEYVHVSESEEMLSGAAEWLLDNHYIVRQAMRQVRKNVPRGYYRRLPKLGSPPWEGVARVYVLARAFVSHEDGMIDTPRLARFVEAYQELAPLTMGEVWALPTILRLVLLELLAQAVSPDMPEDVAESVASIPRLEVSENLAQVSLVGNCIRGLRALAAEDWEAFFEEVSRVDALLRQDPAGVYPRMDFLTRNRYRLIVEELAGGEPSAEEEVAGLAVDLAQRTRSGGEPAARRGHVGYYLLDKGYSELKSLSGLRPAPGVRLRRGLLERAAGLYLGSIALLTLAIVTVLAILAWTAGGSGWQVVAVVLLTFLPALLVAVNVVNVTATRLVAPGPLPKMDFRHGVPAAHETMVVVPALLTDADEIDSLLAQLERHFLANRDPHLHFALLTDPMDAPQKQMPEDEELIEQARQGIDQLNARYRQANGSVPYEPFHLYHRRRLWNSAEGVWMGWERKRGKLSEFSRLLAGRGETSYAVQVGDARVLSRIRYVVTVDADTVLPRDSVQRLVGTLAHPLNRAEFATGSQEVVAGYTVLQPRVEILPISANRSPFSRIFAGDIGLDLYTRAVSDVYQDLFGEGIFVGKGIYDVEAFERALEGRVPDNALLSHDLFEGIHGRAGLVTDVVLYEDYPPSYLVYSQRLHRWFRGDWQLLPWLFRRVPGAEGQRRANTFSLLDRWKIVDNLRRSLHAASVLALLVAGWLFLPGAPLLWTLVALSALAVPLVSGFITSLLRSLRRSSGEAVFAGLGAEAARWLLAVVFLPYEAIIALDAIATTLVRLYITRKGLLKWTTHADTVRLFWRGGRAGAVWQRMGGGVLLVLGLLLALVLVRPDALLVAAPVLLAWLLSPLVALYISQPTVRERASLSADGRRQMQALARRTWLFFEHFAGPEDHWLPPDHYQEDPRGVVAHRTSPTNIGLYLVATLVAHEMGYIGPVELLLRLRSSLDSMSELERYRGHFLNWYETRGLKTLSPRYVSTVDSGNLAACLLILEQAAQTVPSMLILGRRWLGLADTLSVLGQVLEQVEIEGVDEPLERLDRFLAALHEELALTQEDPARWPAFVGHLRNAIWPELQALLSDLLETGSGRLRPATLRDLRLWSERIWHHLQSMEEETDLLLSWQLLLDDPPSVLERANLAPDLADAWQSVRKALPRLSTLQELLAVSRVARPALQRLQGLLETRAEAAALPGAGELDASEWQEANEWCARLAAGLETAGLAAGGLAAGLEEVGRQAEAYFLETDFAFLYDGQRRVFYLGYDLAAEKLDENHYDLLASEARTASLIAIAKGDVPQSHWLHLDRPVGRVGDTRVLLSWNGSMFEYLMPELFMRTYDDLLLQETHHGAVEQQKRHARQHGVPWGISESGYYRFDANQNYQYRGFGVPGLGRKRGLDEDLVITPYASLLALPIDPRSVERNLKRLESDGMMGHFGLYEAIDFTTRRLPMGRDRAIVRSYMAHHQGMILSALANSLLDDLLVDYFHQDARIQSVELLLQEQVPRTAPLEGDVEDRMGTRRTVDAPAALQPWFVTVDSPQPQAHLLSNGRYGVILTSAGAGYSTWQDMDLTRWRADTTLEDWGTWIYVQDVEAGGGELWSAGLQPTGRMPQQASTRFSAHSAELQRRDHDVTVRTEVAVAPRDDMEVRLLTLTNHTPERRRLRVVSYGEVVLTSQDADRRHPAFNKLFIQSEYVPDLNGLLFWRRPRTGEEPPVYLLHLLLPPTGTQATGGHEADRARFLGRGGSPRRPLGLEADQGRLRQAAEAAGPEATLDPVFSVAQEVVLRPHASVQMAFLTLAAPSRQEALDLARRYRSLPAATRVFEQALSEYEAEARNLGLDTEGLRHAQQLLSALIYPNRALRVPSQLLAANRQGQPGLWGHAISGDYPILLVRIKGEEDLDLVREVLPIHAFWRRKQIKIDLVILNAEPAGYAQELHGHLLSLLRSADADLWINRRGGIFLLQAGQVEEAGHVLLSSAARVVLDAERGSLARQIEPLSERPVSLPQFVPTHPGLEDPGTLPPLPRPQDLLFDNGLGGFSPDGREYMIYLEPGQHTPAPWVNVVANPRFGFIASESGLGFSWAANSGENRLTPWDNDPVRDVPHEVLYLRDEETAEVWSSTPSPAGADSPYLVRHGTGYSIYEHNSHGLKQRMRVFADRTAPVKVVQLRLENTWNRTRRITATFYAEWVLGIHRDQSQQFVVPEYDAERRALLARNAYHVEFGEAVAFVAASQGLHGLTADRTEFLGRRGSYQQPAALQRVGLASELRAGLDPCAALQVHINLEPNATQEIYFLLGQGADREESLALIDRYSDTSQIEAAWEEVTGFWDELLATVQVQTPDPAMDLLLNRWLLYQDLSCRIWGRSALYQSGGAFGFRDQLQDVTAVLHAAPEVAREHIRSAARHQFVEGDVLHWWHPPSGRGIRTRMTDDLLWLPYVTAEYVATTGDEALLHEEEPFVTGEPLEPQEAEVYGHWETTDESYSIYEHCCRAIDRGSTAGPHGLPLMGTGDWNDGMNRVGAAGRGESVWLGWFLYTTLERFAPLCERLDDQERAKRYRQRARELHDALEAHAWDGEWYLRAYYDDGTPLGSADNRECQIDSLAQSWAVLSGAGDEGRARQAMESVAERLVRSDDRLLLLFTPPFDKTPRDPGYIKGYPPGIRENGGQYTHAALWAVWAFAELGDGDRAEELYRMLNPIYHSDSPEGAGHYQVEPYVMAADVYGAPPHTGKGGWTWYTGSGGWTYRLGLEAILGFRRRGNVLRLRPRIPAAWPGYQLTYRWGQSRYHIQVSRPGDHPDGREILLDGKPLDGDAIELVDDGGHHEVLVCLDEEAPGTAKISDGGSG